MRMLRRAPTRAIHSPSGVISFDSSSVEKHLFTEDEDMGRRSLTGGVKPLGSSRIQFDFRIGGVRYRPSLPWIPHETNLRRAREYLANVKARIDTGTFRFSEFFPDLSASPRVPLPLSGRTLQ